MRIALLMNPWQLTFRGKWTWDDIYNDPRGMSGSELGFVEIGKQLAAMGHSVDLFTDTECGTFQGPPRIPVHEWGKWNHAGDIQRKADLAIAINHPGGLEHFDCPKLVFQWLNSFEYMTRDEFRQVDLWLSPSEAHREYLLSTHEHQLADGFGILKPNNIGVLPLGCTPELYDGIEKVPGRVVYTSSPDRGLHHLLHVWPRIKRAVPHAELEIYYRLRPWISELKAAPDDFAPVQENRQRALFVDEALRRLEGDKWGVRVMGAVSRNRIARAIGEAECFAYPCQTLRFSEGFSCSTLEAVAAGSRPVIFDCDALGQVYKDSGTAVVPLGDLERFTQVVISTLEGPKTPEAQLAWKFEAEQAKAFAREHTWKNTCEKLLALTQGLSTQPTPGPVASADSSPSEATSSETPAAASST